MKKYILVFAIPLFILSCSKDSMEQEPPTTMEEENEPESLSYNGAIKALFQANCTTCHSGNNPPAGIDLTTYDNVKLHVSSGKVLAAMKNEANPMPPNGLLPSTETDLIEEWIAKGFPEN